MISSIKGTLLSVFDKKLTIDLGSLGITLEVPNAHHYTPNTTVNLHTYLHWHPEQGMQLFGFADIIEKELFLTIIDCSGIGPKLALTMLNQLTPTTIITAVQTEDHKTLASVSGIGTKKAEHLIVQLRHKIARLLEKHPTAQQSAHSQDWQTINQVLGSLQYNRTEIAAAVNYLKTLSDTTMSFDTKLRKALTFLAKP